MKFNNIKIEKVTDIDAYDEYDLDCVLKEMLWKLLPILVKKKEVHFHTEDYIVFPTGKVFKFTYYSQMDLILRADKLGFDLTFKGIEPTYKRGDGVDWIVKLKI